MDKVFIIINSYENNNDGMTCVEAVFADEKKALAFIKEKGEELREKYKDHSTYIFDENVNGRYYCAYEDGFYEREHDEWQLVEAEVIK